MATTGFDLLAQAGVQNAERQAATRQEAEVEQRQQKLATYKNALDHAQTPEDRQQIFTQIQTLYPTPGHAKNLLADILHIRGKSKTSPAGPAAVPGAVRQVAQAQSPDDALKLIMGNYSSAAQDATKTEKEKEDAAYKLQELRNAGALATAGARSANARPVHIGDVTPQNAISDMHTFGYEYDDENGQPITEAQLSEAPPGSKLVAFRQGKDTFYKVMDQNEKNVNIGGIAYAVAPLGPQGPQTMTPLGTAEGALTREHQVPGMNPGEKINLTSGPTATPGITAPPVSAKTPQPPGSEPTLKNRSGGNSETMVVPSPKGLVEAGNLPIWNRPTVQNADGSHSSELSISMGDEQGREVLIPTVANGRFLTPDGKMPPLVSGKVPPIEDWDKYPAWKALKQAAWSRFQQTGEHLGKFDNPDDADAYAQVLHNRGARVPVSSKTPQPPSLGAANRDALNAKLNAKKPNSRQVPATGAVPPPPPPFAPGTMLTQGRAAQPVVASMNTVAAQVFGGDGEPPIWTNAWMFDQPQLRTALNKALTLNALSIPGTEEDPSFMQTLATAAGITGWSQQQIQQANVKAREDLQKLGGDDALNMFARMAGMQEDLSALRAATKGSAAQGSIRTLVRAAPVYNVESSKNFRDQLAVTLNTASAAMSGYPAINPAYLEWFKKGAQMARGASPVSSKTPSAPGQHTYAIDDKGKKYKVTDANAPLPKGWKWAN